MKKKSIIDREDYKLPKNSMTHMLLFPRHMHVTQNNVRHIGHGNSLNFPFFIIHIVQGKAKMTRLRRLLHKPYENLIKEGLVTNSYND